MSPSRIGVEVAVFLICLGSYVGSGVVFGDGVPPARWIALFVVAYGILTGVRPRLAAAPAVGNAPLLTRLASARDGP